MTSRALELIRIPFRAMRRATFWWAVGIGALIGLTVAFWPVFNNAPGISAIIDTLPPGVIEAFGLEDFGSPAGFLRGNLYEFFVPLVLAAAAVALANGQTASEEANGRLEIYLAQPVDRRAVFLGRATGVLVALVIITLAILVVQLLSDAIVGLRIDSGLVVATIVLTGLLAALHGSLALAIAGFAARPSLVLGVGVAVAILGYVVSALFPLSDVLEPLSHVSPWDWALGGDPLIHQAEAWRYAALIVPTLALTALGVWAFGRRDVAAA